MYNKFKIKKNSGGVREIYSYKNKEDKLRHRYVYVNNKFFLQNINPKWACGFNGKQLDFSVRQHKTNNVFLHLDIKNFFPSITKKNFYKEVQDNEDLLRFKEILVDDLAFAVLESFDDKGKLCQGSVLAPTISNIYLSNLDKLMTQSMLLTHQNINLKYTRYADDIVISCYYENKKGEEELEKAKQVLFETKQQIVEELTRLKLKLKEEKEEMRWFPKHNHVKILSYNIVLRWNVKHNFVSIGRKKIKNKEIHPYVIEAKKNRLNNLRLGEEYEIQAEQTSN